MSNFFSHFIPLLVAIDPIGIVPVFLALTAGMDKIQRRKISIQAVATATLIATAFLFLGRWIFQFLNITADDFRIGGGIILLVLAVYDLIIYGKPAVSQTRMVGLVPLAMPLIAGPALLTTTLVLTGQPAETHPFLMTTLALGLNMVLLLVVLLSTGWISRMIGEHALAAMSKLVMVFLAAIAVNFIRVGITNIIISI